MVNPKDYLEMGLKFHGHKCPAMPMGLRAGAAAMNKLGIGRTGDSEWLALVEIGENHCATCFADGVQVITGCTFGKGNIKKLDYGKWGLTLINKKAGKAVRVAPKAETMAQNKQSTFFTEYRTKGVPPTKVPAEVVDPLIQRVMNAPEEMLFNVSEIFDYPYQEKKHSFESFVCEECGEMVVEQYGRIKNGKKVCPVCLGWDK
ncbi:FmdE family protein [Desulfotomaculum copahuensis]|uniref:FmdE family protein n=1 Tax=Desulfotomaculum copahuensis TaxID=1838280 RepID=UPI00098EFF7E|nr:FmdE family protein [Desulfotomaculum copahuensis]